MAEALSIRMQPQCVDNVDKIAQKRISEGIKDSRSRIVAEAVSLLAKKELGDTGSSEV